MSRHISPYLYARLTQYLVSGLNRSFLYWSPDWSINSGLLGLRLLDQIQSMAEYWFLTSKIMHWTGKINFFFFLSPLFSDSSNEEAAFPQDEGRILAWGKRETTTGFSSCEESRSSRLCHMYAGQQTQLLRSIFMCTRVEGGWYLSYLVPAAQAGPLFTFSVVCCRVLLVLGFWNGWLAIFLSFEKSRSYVRE